MSAGRPIERAPVDRQAQVALALRGEAADRRAVEGEVVVALEQEFLVVVEHVQAAFEVAEQHRHGLDALLVGEILQPFFLDLVGGDTLPALLLRPQVQLFQLVVRQRQEIAKFGRHASPSIVMEIGFAAAPDSRRAHRGASRVLRSAVRREGLAVAFRVSRRAQDVSLPIKIPDCAHREFLSRAGAALLPGVVPFPRLTRYSVPSAWRRLQAEAVVLRTWPVHEADEIVSLFTRS